MSGKSWFAAMALAAMIVTAPAAHAASRKSHSAVFGVERTVPYSQAGDPAGAAPGESALKVRGLFVGGVLKEWTTGEVHDVTERSFVVRRAMRLNNSLPTDKKIEWVWQRGPWLLVDRETGHITALKLPDYDPAVSRVVWFRDYGAYCGVTPSGKSLYAVVAQIAVRRAALSKKISSFDPADHPQPACAPAEWQRTPLQVTFHPTGRAAVSYAMVAGSAVLVEGGDDDAGGKPEPPAPAPAPSQPKAPPAQQK